MHQRVKPIEDKTNVPHSSESHILSRQLVLLKPPINPVGFIEATPNQSGGVKKHLQLEVHIYIYAILDLKIYGVFDQTTWFKSCCVQTFIHVEFFIHRFLPAEVVGSGGIQFRS